MRGNITRLFFEQVERQGDATAFIENDRSTTFSELAGEVRRMAAWLQKRGIAEGDNVLVLIPMSLDLYRTLIALFHIGATAVFVDAWAGADRIDMAATRLPIAAFVGSAKAHLLRLKSPALRRIPIKLVSSFAGWRRTSPLQGEALEPDPGRAALVTFTTGSTGIPKGAVRTHDFLAIQHRELVVHTRPRAGSAELATLPIFPLSNLASGVATLLAPIDPRRPDRFDAARVVATMKRHSVVCTVASPAFFEKLALYLLEKQIRLDCLERLFVGGAAVYRPTAERMRRVFPAAEIVILYGATEVEPISAIGVDEYLAIDSRERGLAAGSPVESLQVRILDLDPGRVYDPMTLALLNESTCNAGQAGEIVVCGEHVLRNYIGDDTGRGSRLMIDGKHWHRTGDAGYLDSAGNLFLLGRISRRIPIASAWLFPVEFERRFVEAGISGTLLHIDSDIVAAVERRSGLTDAGMAQLLAPMALPFTRLEIFGEIPRDPRHRSKIDYEKLTRAIMLRVSGARRDA